MAIDKTIVIAQIDDALQHGLQPKNIARACSPEAPLAAEAFSLIAWMQS